MKQLKTKNTTNKRCLRGWEEDVVRNGAGTAVFRYEATSTVGLKLKASKVSFGWRGVAK